MLMRQEEKIKTKSFIQLEMLSWYLKEHLPSLCPELFSRGVSFVAPFQNQGVSNLTLIAQNRQKEEFFVRLKQLKGGLVPDNEVMPTCFKESWISRLPELDGLVPRSPEQGIGILQDPDGRTSYSYLIQERLPFSSAEKVLSEREREKILIQLGEKLRLIEQVPLIGYGQDFLAKTNTFSNFSWKSLLKDRSNSLALEGLLKSRVISRSLKEKFSELILSLEALQPSGALYHSDFLRNWGNILIDKENNVQAIIDWELAGSGFGAIEDFVSFEYVLIRDGVSIDTANRERAALLKGYGLTCSDYRERFGAVLDILLAEKAVEKVYRYNTFQEQGRLVHPWQKKFAQRAHRYLLNILKEAKPLSSRVANLAAA